ncbi:polysaccharide pyruvyl transferase family protein [uncultured Flavobacterium sp.]|uniref:polysaccharide pyruvyl transferase family protein n=1 Tax=uncultured Flavobacterium sp. TaxID=165435 RepID=UPI0030EC8BAE
MKIKTITCHEVYNHGASLQEYALLTHLNSVGHDAETIHYKPFFLSNHFKFWSVANPKYDKLFLKQLYLLLKFPGRLLDLRRKKNFDLFSKKHIATGKTLYKNNDELKKNLPIADAYICGSDQIWNSFFLNGKDPAFYLDFVPIDKLKISYAASFATDAIDNNLKPFVKEKISRINAISVRETSGVKILNELGINNVLQVLDPVFLLSKEYWRDTFIKDIGSNYIFVYDSDNNQQLKKIAQKIAKQENYKIYTVDKHIKYADKNFYFEAPDCFLSLILHSKLVLTNSFHALSFSLIFNKKFLVFNRLEKINTRMRDLMILTKTDYLLISEENNIEINLDQIVVDYNVVNNIIENKVNESKLFLEKAL